jgi:Ca2+-transporting ATPase
MAPPDASRAVAGPGPVSSAPRAWHALDGETALRLLDSNLDHGLTTAEARRRLLVLGPNRVADAPETPLWRVAAHQFRSLVVLLLLAAALLAALLGETAESLAILAALLLNAAIGFTTEWRARISLSRLRGLAVRTALVRRDGRVQQIEAEQLVPGDIVVLDAGAHVPADGRLVRSARLGVTEAALTGESGTVGKDPGVALDADTGLADRTTMVYLGTAAVAGSGLAVVTATGDATELGRIGQLIERGRERATPLERQVEGLGRRLIVVALVTCAVVAVAGVLHGQPWGLMLETAITLAVSAIPEGLPAVVTVALAAGLWRLARAGALVRRLPAVETLGATTVICADKTGTMTENRMTVTRVVARERTLLVNDAFTEQGRPVDVRGDEALVQLLTVLALANDASVERRPDGVRLHGDPTETALLAAALAAGIDPVLLAQQWPRLAEIPFSSDTRLMATLHRTPHGDPAWLVKGAPGALLDRCIAWQTAAAVEPLTDTARERLLDENRQLARQGYRVLAAAWQPQAADGVGPARLVFLGFVGLDDPVRPGVKDALARCREAGIRSIMLTGDQRSTA